MEKKKTETYLFNLIGRIVLIFGARSLKHLALIFIIFGVSGSLSVFVSGQILETLGLEPVYFNTVLYWSLRIVILFFVYQIILILVSICFGEFQHFSKYSLRFIKLFKSSRNNNGN